MVKLGEWQCILQYFLYIAKPTDFLPTLVTLVSHQELHREAGVRAAHCENSREAAEGAEASDARRTHTAPHPGELLPFGL